MKVYVDYDRKRIETVDKFNVNDLYKHLKNSISKLDGWTLGVKNKSSLPVMTEVNYEKWRGKEECSTA